MKNTSFLFLLSFFLSSPFFSIAQKQFLDASITINDGEVLQGELLLKFWKTSPRTIHFRMGDSDFKTYGISEVKAFEVTRADGSIIHYVRKQIEIETSPNSDVSKLVRFPELNFRRDTAWLELIYRGGWDLFFLKDKEDKIHYLLGKAGENPIDLVSKNWEKEAGGVFRIEKVELFRKQLLDYSQGCPQLISFITEMKFTQEDLIEICMKHDECKGVKPEYQQKKMRGTFSGHVLAGVHYSKVHFSPFFDREIKKIPGGQIGFGVAYYPGRSNHRISLYNEVMVYSDEKTDSIKLRSYDLFSSALSYKTWQIGISSLVSFELFHSSSVRPTVKFGMFNRVGISKQISRTDPPNAKTIDLSYAKKTYELGPEVILSFEYQKFGLEFRYFRSSLVGGYLVEGANSEFLGVSLNYRVF